MTSEHAHHRAGPWRLAMWLASALVLLLIVAGATACRPEGLVNQPVVDGGDGDGDADGAPDGDADGDAEPEDGGPDGDSPRPDGDVDGGAPGLRHIGRYLEVAPGQHRFGWPGTGVAVRFRGTAARARMDDGAGYFTVVVDGRLQPTLATEEGERTYDLATGLSDGEHTVELTRRTEGWGDGLCGPTTLLEVQVDGELLPPAPAPGRRIEAIGDSITCGYGVEGPDEYCSFSRETENHYATYVAIAARELGADLSTVAWSGKGVVCNYGDDCFEPLPALYDRAVPTEGAAWGFGWQPHAVVVNLGTNDYSTDGDPSEEEFVAAYVGFLEHIRSRYPGALILCSVAPLLDGDDDARAVAYIQSAVAERNAAGDSRVEWLDLRVENIGWGCDWHPSHATHEAMADILVAALRRELGW